MKQYAQMILTYKINLNLDKHFSPKGFKNINCKKQGALKGLNQCWSINKKTPMYRSGIIWVSKSDPFQASNFMIPAMMP
jgi:hypothetical protein